MLVFIDMAFLLVSIIGRAFRHTKQLAIFIRLTGQPLVSATKYEQEVFRRSACQELSVPKISSALLG